MALISSDCCALWLPAHHNGPNHLGCCVLQGGLGDVLYAASWAPGQDGRIVASSASGKIFVVEIAEGKGKVALTLQVSRGPQLHNPYG